MACVEECESRWSSSRVYVLTQATVINARTVDAFLRTHIHLICVWYCKGYKSSLRREKKIILSEINLTWTPFNMGLNPNTQRVAYVCPHLQGGAIAWVQFKVSSLFLESRFWEQAISIFNPLGIASWVLRNHICHLETNPAWHLCGALGQLPLAWQQ